MSCVCFNLFLLVSDVFFNGSCKSEKAEAALMLVTPHSLRTMRWLVQVQRVSFELAMPALMQNITADSNHGPADFISDVDVMTVYLECMVCPQCKLVVH